MPDRAARLFAVPPGVDYAAALVEGLVDRLGSDPVEMAWTRIYVNSGRMGRHIQHCLCAGPARLLPRIELIAGLAEAPGFPEIPPARKALDLKLDLAQLILALIDRNPGLAPRSAAFDLAENLAALIDEMEGEGVSREALMGIDVGDHARHWVAGRGVLAAAMDHVIGEDGPLASAEARRRRVIEALTARWDAAPPDHAVVVAGSTGSRGATRLFMEAVARLPRGYVVLPGYDTDQPDAVWRGLDTATAAEDHPQYRFRALMRGLDLTPDAVRPWTGAGPAAPARNRLVSLALRPAPVTDQWRDEGQGFEGITEAARDMTLIEAPTPRDEAVAIALRLRAAVEDGTPAALITPDRMLTRRVAAALARWGIEPDDSAGEPLHQTAPGRFLRHVALLLAEPPDLPALLTLLKHPLATSSDGLRGDHLRWTRELELYLRRRAVARPTGSDLRDWAERTKTEDARGAWAAWLGAVLDGIGRGGSRGLGAHVARHRALAEALARGPAATGAGRLWQGRAGEEASEAMEVLAAAGGSGGDLSDRDYGNLLRSHLNGYPVQDPRGPHPGVMVWGTLEARVRTVAVTILAGLNDGSWPDLPSPDPWLNREMRARIGLLLPDRRIGLAAHDFQMAIAAPTVVLSRSKRDADAETIPSRWLNRLTNLLSGMGPEGEAALAGMRKRGATWLAQAAALDRPAAAQPPAPRPSPCPPVAARPRQLAVTGITTLIRDPYAIYARHVLQLRPLPALSPLPDAAIKGSALHRIMEHFIADRARWQGDHGAARAALSEIAQAELARATPLPAMQTLWHARLMAIADRLITGEHIRLESGAPVLIEETGGVSLDGLEFRLTARPDRIDRRGDGSFAIYDYKSGSIPSLAEIRHFAKQLPLEAALLERGGFTGLRGAVSAMGFISLGTSADREIPVDDDGAQLSDVTWDKLRDLIAAYREPGQGYTASRAAKHARLSGDYDHLARFGEWDLTEAPVRITVGTPEGSA